MKTSDKGSLSRIPVVGKTTSSGPLAVQTLDSVFTKLAQKPKIPTVVVNVSLDQAYAIEAHKSLPDGTITFLCDKTTAVWQVPGDDDTIGIGAYRAIVQLCPKPDVENWTGPLLTVERETEGKAEESEEHWTRHVLETHIGGQAEGQAKLDARPVSGMYQ